MVPAEIPLPVSSTTWEPRPSFPTRSSDADDEPIPWGANCTSSVIVWCGNTVMGSTCGGSTREKPPDGSPDICTDRLVVPVFETRTVRWDVVDRSTAPKARAWDETASCGEPAVVAAVRPTDAVP